MQDDKGFLWFGTNDGLNKFDGYNFTVFKPSVNSSNSIPGRIISDICSDPFGRIWISTLDNGLTCYISEKESFIRLNHLIPSPGPHAMSIKIGGDSVLWIKSRSNISYAVIQKDVTSMKFKTFSIHNIENQTTGYTNRFSIYKGKPLILINNNRYVIDYKKQNEGISNVSVRAASNNSTLVLKQGFKGIEWEVHKDKLVCKKDSLRYELKSILRIGKNTLVDHEGNFWCIVNNRLHQYYLQQGHINEEIIDFEDINLFGLKNNTIISLFMDRTGNIWIGTNGAGIYKLVNNQSYFHHINKQTYKNGLSNNIIRSIHEDQFENLWIGTKGGGINLIDKYNVNYDNIKSVGFSSTSKGLSSPNVFSISENVINRDSSILWLATETGGLNKLILTRNKRFEHFTFEHFTKSDVNSSIRSEAIHSILSEGKNLLWIGYYGHGLGVATWTNALEKPLFKIINRENHQGALSGNIIRNILRDSFGKLWIATNNGLNVMNENSSDITKSTFHSFTNDPNDPNSISANYILQLFESSDSTMWVGTFGGGLNKMIKEKSGNVIGFTHYNTDNNLFPDDVINSIQEDNSGMLWIGTNIGIVKFNPLAETYTVFGLNELRNPQMGEIASVKRKNGEMVFGGINGINIFDPSNINTDNIKPTIVISELSILNKTVNPNEKIGKTTVLTRNIAYTESLRLKSSLNSISLKFSSLHFNAPDKNRFRYMMEGFDKEWVETNSDNRIATYTNLPPGKYLFKVHGSNNSGEWSEQPASLLITILPPWYASKLAWFMYVVAAVLLVLQLRRSFLMKIEKDRKLEYEKLEKEKEKLLNDEKFRFFTNISHELRSPLTLISSPIDKLIVQEESLSKEDRMKLYRTMKRNSDYLLKLIKQLLDFRKLEQGKMKLECIHINLVNLIDKTIELFIPLADEKKITVNSRYESPKIFAWIDIDKVEKIMHNLLSNALKYTPKGGRVHVQIRTTEEKGTHYPDGHIEIQINDSGIGIDEKELTNIFDRFYQANHKKTENKGVGIGLSYALSLAQMHGGTIKVTSKINEGSCFTLILPLGNSHLTNDQMLDDNQINLTSPGSFIETVHNDEKSGYIEYKNGDKPVVLIIEDNTDINHYIAAELNPFFSVIGSIDAIKGLEIAHRVIPDIIISDIMMPGIDGIELCRKIKTDINTSHIPVILLSAKTTDENKVEGLDAGADVYLTKPFNMEVLKSQIISLLENRRLIQQEFKNPSLEPPKINISTVDNKFLADIIEIIERNIDNSEFTVQEFTILIGLSRTSFFKKMKSLTGQKPTEFLRNYRLKTAAQYLEKGYSVKETMFKTGFNTASYFSQSFKELFAMTPTEYIELHKRNDFTPPYE
jgi:signal transduction histidine kinase/DNA-binding response OmpR family regulator/streptogramin lyase